jgi:hypothetical protein
VHCFEYRATDIFQKSTESWKRVPGNAHIPENHGILEEFQAPDIFQKTTESWKSSRQWIYSRKPRNPGRVPGAGHIPENHGILEESCRQRTYSRKPRILEESSRQRTYSRKPRNPGRELQETDIFHKTTKSWKRDPGDRHIPENHGILEESSRRQTFQKITESWKRVPGDGHVTEKPRNPGKEFKATDTFQKTMESWNRVQFCKWEQRSYGFL